MRRKTKTIRRPVEACHAAGGSFRLISGGPMVQVTKLSATQPVRREKKATTTCTRRGPMTTTQSRTARLRALAQLGMTPERFKAAGGNALDVQELKEIAFMNRVARRRAKNN